MMWLLREKIQLQKMQVQMLTDQRQWMNNMMQMQKEMMFQLKIQPPQSK